MLAFMRPPLPLLPLLPLPPRVTPHALQGSPAELVPIFKAEIRVKGGISHLIIDQFVHLHGITEFICCNARKEFGRRHPRIRPLEAGVLGNACGKVLP